MNPFTINDRLFNAPPSNHTKGSLQITPCRRCNIAIVPFPDGVAVTVIEVGEFVGLEVMVGTVVVEAGMNVVPAVRGELIFTDDDVTPRVEVVITRVVPRVERCVVKIVVVQVVEGTN